MSYNRDRQRLTRQAQRAKNPAKEKAYYRDYRERNLVRCRLRSRHYNWRTKGIDPKEAEALLASHDGRCALCSRDTPGGRGYWHVDHDHESGKLRGVLCAGCNLMLGGAERVGLNRIEEYLRRCQERG